MGWHDILICCELRMQLDPHEIFEKRMEKFRAAIKRDKMKQLKRINDQADEEEEVELGKIKRDARNKDEDLFRKMENDVKVAEKIFKSRKVTDCRMKEMKVRFDMIEKVEKETKEALKNLTKDKPKYKQLLRGLIKQGLIKPLEENVEVRCLREEEGLIKEVMGEVQREFNSECAVQSTMVIATANYLEAADLGGVILTSFKGRIVCDNSLRARLTYCMQMLLPEMRFMLFHESDEFLAERRKLKKQQQQQQGAGA